MIIIEFPVVYFKNCEEIENAIEANIPQPKGEEDVIKTTFYIPETETLRIVPYEGKTVICFVNLNIDYTIDADYETVIGMLNQKLKLTNQ